MMPFVESFEDVHNEGDDEKVDPTNIACERGLSVLKYTENRLIIYSLDHHSVILFPESLSKILKLSVKIDSSLIYDYDRNNK